MHRKGYKEANKLLPDEYGSDLKIANSYLQKLNDWPPFKNNDVNSMQELLVFLISCHNYSKNMSAIYQLESLK
jgi:hypothetical protein